MIITYTSHQISTVYSKHKVTPNQLINMSDQNFSILGGFSEKLSNLNFNYHKTVLFSWITTKY